MTVIGLMAAPKIQLKRLDMSEPDRYIYACVSFICLVSEACRETLQDYSIVV